MVRRTAPCAADTTKSLKERPWISAARRTIASASGAIRALRGAPYEIVSEASYYARLIAEAEREDRIGRAQPRLDADGRLR